MIVDLSAYGNFYESLALFSPILFFEVEYNFRFSGGQKPQ